MKKHFFLLIMLATCSLGTMAQTTYNVGDVVHSCTATLDDWTISGNSNSESFQVDTWANVDSYLDAGVGYIEYWVYRDGNLSAATITHTQLKDLPEGTYSVSIKARVESEVGNTPTSGISFTANTESVDLVENGTDDATLTDGGKALVGTYTLEVEVTDGTLDIGFTVPSGANYNWLAFQYLTVTYEGKTGEELEYVTGTMNKDVEDAMKDAVDTYNESMTTENLSAATAAIAAANASVEYYASITAVVEALDEAGTAVWEASDAYTAYTNCTLSDEDLSETFAKAQIAQTTKGSDMTYVLTTTGEWTILQGNGYYNSNDDHQSPAGLPDAQETYSYGTEEYPIFTEGGVMYKTITGLPEGTYEVTFYAQENACNDVDTEHSGAGYCQAYANDVTADMSLGTTGTSGYSDDDLFTLSPVEVGEDGELKFGVTNLQTGGNWCYCMAVSLTYLGSGAITENMQGVYLLNVADGEFLSRGSEWGTEADLDHYGIPVNILVADDGTLTVQFMDSELYLYGPNWAWTDAAEADATSFTVAQAVDENGDKVESDYGTVYTFSCSAGLLYVNHSVDGLPLAVNGHKEVTTEDPNYDDDEQTYWVVVDKATRDQIKADWVEEQQAAIAASLGLSTDDLSTATGTDMTDKVSNASLVDESAADDEGSVLGGWTNTYSTNDTFSFYTYNNGTEIFQGAATLSQTVTGLTPGAYKVTIEGLMRQGSNARCYALMEGEYDLSIGYLKANDYEINLQPWYVGCSYDEGSQAYTPDNRSQASDACDNGDYDNTLYTVVGDDGELTITIGCPGTDTYGWLYVKNLK
ncbi:MAG: hypothetical protein LUC33_07510, partial [Prevotellaceae bacterium]|nr:hypothetical protein [Prevotellaceae bacterium]